METFSVLLAISAGNSPVPGEFPAQRPVTRSFDVFFYLRLNKRLSKQSWDWWFETLPCSLWRHRNVCSVLLCWGYKRTHILLSKTNGTWFLMLNNIWWLPWVTWFGHIWADSSMRFTSSAVIRKTIYKSTKLRCSRQAIYQFVFYTLLLGREQMLNNGNDDRIFASPLSFVKDQYCDVPQTCIVTPFKTRNVSPECIEVLGIWFRGSSTAVMCP